VWNARDQWENRRLTPHHPLQSSASFLAFSLPFKKLFNFFVKLTIPLICNTACLSISSGRSPYPPNLYCFVITGGGDTRTIKEPANGCYPIGVAPVCIEVLASQCLPNVYCSVVSSSSNNHSIWRPGNSWPGYLLGYLPGYKNAPLPYTLCCPGRPSCFSPLLTSVC